MDKTLYGLLMGKIKSVSQDFRDLMTRQEKQDERIKRIESMQDGSCKQDDILFFGEEIDGNYDGILAKNINIPENIEEYCIISLTQDVKAELVLDGPDEIPAIEISNKNRGYTFCYFIIVKQEIVNNLDITYPQLS